MSEDKFEGGFVSHLAELRQRLIHSFIFLIVFLIAGLTNLSRKSARGFANSADVVAMTATPPTCTT